MRLVGWHPGAKLSEVWRSGRQFKPQILLNSIQSLPLFSFNCCHSRETSLAEISCRAAGLHQMTARSAAPAREMTAVGRAGKFQMDCESKHELCP